MYENLNNLEQKYKMHEFPLNISIEPTNYCNFNCVMCVHDKLTRPKGVMDIRLYKKIIDEIAVKNPDSRVYIDFCGEPLILKYKLYYMIDYAKNRGLQNININTNGSLLNEEMAEMLLDSGISYVSLDCDGFSSEVYEKIRVGGNRDTFFKNVNYLLHRRAERKMKTPIIDVKIIEMPENQAEVDKVMKYWQNQGAWVAKRRQHSWGGSNVHVNLAEQNYRIACGKAIGVMAITWDGKVCNCTSDTDNVVTWGDVNTESIAAIWKRRNEALVKYHLSHEFDKLPPICHQCNDWQIVGEERFDEHGNPINKNYDDKGNVFKETNVCLA